MRLISRGIAVDLGEEEWGASPDSLLDELTETIADWLDERMADLEAEFERLFPYGSALTLEVRD